MRSVDIAYAGVAIDAFNASGAGPDVPVTGFRIIPVLAAGATQADLLAAYATLAVTVTKQSKAFPAGTTESAAVPGPDWIAGVGIGRIIINQGLSGTLYRVWLATDCKEMEFVETPIMNGFASAGAAPGAGSNTSSNETQLAAGAAAPTLSSDGVDITGAKSIRLNYKAANAGATMNAVGSAQAWWYSSTLSRWVRCPELDYNFAAAGVAPVEPAGTGPAPMPIVTAPSITRLQYVSNGMTVSAGVNVIRSLEVQR